MRYLLLAALCCAPLVGCDDSESGGTTEGPARDAFASDGFVDDRGVGPDTDSGARADASVPPDGAVTDGLVPDAAGNPLIRDVENCEDVCGVYESCGRIDDLFGGEQEACLTACAFGEPSDRFRGYLSCMQITACNRLNECTLPPRPAPDCLDVCAAATACDTASAVTTLLGADCAAICEQPGVALDLQRCGLPLIDAAEGEACGGEAFTTCILDERFGDCVALCGNIQACESPESDLLECVRSCANPPELEDPIGTRRFTLGQNCRRMADDCDAYARCTALTSEIVGERTIEELCTANAECPLFELDTCAEQAQEALAGLVDGAIDCLYDSMTQSCGEAPYACFRRAPPPADACSEHCLVSDLCGLLPEGQNEGVCLDLCRQNLVSDDPVVADDTQRLMECAFVDSCQALTFCQARTDAEDVCRPICQRQIECGSEGREACFETCQEDFGYARTLAEVSCAEVAGSCEGLASCITPDGPNCESLCGYLEACDLAGSDCLRECDDADFANDGSFFPRLSCLASTAQCGERAQCEAGDLTGGEGCLAWCKLTVGCNGGPDGDMDICLQACGEGDQGPDGLQYGNARECLLEVGSGGTCEDLRACSEAVELADFCGPYCAELGRCRLDADAAACELDCRGRLGDLPFIVGAGCTMAGQRRGEGCGAVVECTGAEVAPAPAGCQAICGAQNACAPTDVDQFLCEQDCAAAPEGMALAAACIERAGCDNIDLCMEAEGEIPQACGLPCLEASLCDGLVGAGEGALFADEDACRLRCGGGAILEGADYARELQACVVRSECDAERIDNCFSNNGNAVCEQTAAILADQCMLIERDAYLELCNQAAPDAAERQAVCVADSVAADPVLGCFTAALACPL